MPNIKERLITKLLFSNTAAKILKKNGRRILEYPFGEHKKMIELLNFYNIDLVLDVGANEGQYAGFLRSIGYFGKIVSFEPLTAAFDILALKSASDVKRTCIKIALGDKEEEAVINVSGNSQSSSLLAMNNIHLEAAPESKYINSEKITVKKLDSIYAELAGSANGVFLKLDVQGFEDKVLKGAEKSLGLIKGLQVEMSFEELYHGEMLFVDMISYLKERGFYLCGLKNGFHDIRTKKLLQADGLFFKIPPSPSFDIYHNLNHT
jgi:FkbM family methyltransferase